MNSRSRESSLKRENHKKNKNTSTEKTLKKDKIIFQNKALHNSSSKSNSLDKSESTEPPLMIRNNNPKKKIPILCQNFGREVLNLEGTFSKLSRKSSESKHLTNQGESGTGIGEMDSNMSGIASCTSKTQEDDKEVSLSKSNKTTINSNYEIVKREKSNLKYPKNKKIIKNNGKFVLSKKAFNLGFNSDQKKNSNFDRSSHIDLSNKKGKYLDNRALENNYCTDYAKKDTKMTFKFGSHQNSIDGSIGYDKSQEKSTKSNFNASTNISKKLNLNELMINIDSQDCKLHLLYVNSSRKSNNEEHTGSLGINYENEIEKEVTHPAKGFIHNKSSNLAFGSNDKVELINPEKPCNKSQENKKKGKPKNKVKKITKEQHKEQSPSDNDQSNEFDDERGDYKAKIGEMIGYRFEIRERLGKGSFGQAFKCWDHKEKEFIALKIIRNKKNLQYQANVEVKVLAHLKENDPDDTHNIIRMKEALVFKNHICVVFELLSINLYEFIKLADFDPISTSLIRRFALQILYALDFLKKEKIIHCDLKPENILLKSKKSSGIKVIDLGSACFIDSKIYTYIQSRFYRAPEIILGVPYSYPIDMWSLGCILAELNCGYPLFPGEDEQDQLAHIMEVLDVPPVELLSKGARTHLFFEENGTPIIKPNSEGKRKYPNTKTLQEVLENNDPLFINFVKKCLHWDPEKRMTPEQAMRDEWVLDALPPQILINHQRLHNIHNSSLPPNVRRKLERFWTRKAKEEKKYCTKSLSIKSTSTDKEHSLSK